MEIVYVKTVKGYMYIHIVLKTTGISYEELK